MALAFAAAAQDPPVAPSVEPAAPDASAAFPGRVPNLLANGDFEELSGRAPAYWDLYILPGSSAAGEADRRAHNGGYSARVEMPNADPANPVLNWSQNILADLAGKTLTVSGYIRTEEATEAALWLQCWTARPARVIHGATTFDASPIYGTQDWRQVEMSVPIPPSTEFVTCRAVLRGRGVAWFDDIVVTVADNAESADPPTPITAKPSPPPPDALTLPEPVAPAATPPSPPSLDETAAPAATLPSQELNTRAAQAAAFAAAAQMNRSLGRLLAEPDEEFAPMEMLEPYPGTDSGRNGSMLRWLLNPDTFPVAPLPLDEERRR